MGAGGAVMSRVWEDLHDFLSDLYHVSLLHILEPVC